MVLNLNNIKSKSIHFPVLIREFLEHLDPKDDGVYLDCTFGAGGYSKSILESSNASVIAIDRDESVIKYANSLKEKFGERFKFFISKFSNIDEIIKKTINNKVDGIVADFGMSNMQVLESQRGFSFKQQGPLLMQMGLNKINAMDFINTAKIEEIEHILLEYGEELQYKRIAKAIVESRLKKVITTTIDLKNIINQAIGNKKNNKKIDRATKSFQAIRIYVNDELNEIKIMLNKSINLLNKNSRLIAVSFHSLEDRIVKLFFNEVTGKFNNHKNYMNNLVFDDNPEVLKNNFKIINKKVITPKFDEIKINRNSKCAKMRILERI